MNTERSCEYCWVKEATFSKLPAESTSYTTTLKGVAVGEEGETTSTSSSS